MERLTKYDFDFNGRKVATVDYTKIRMNTHFDENGRNAEDYYFGKAIDKLAEYENAEEQGLLVRLPIAIGTPIYCLTYQFDYKKHKNNLVIVNSFFDYYMLGNDYKGLWFLTEAEALQALKERE